MKQFFKWTSLSALALCLFVPLALQAKKGKRKGKVNIYNCSAKDKDPSTKKYKFKITVCVYDGSDISKSTARHRRTLIPGKKWRPWCYGKGKGNKHIVGSNTKRCKVYITAEAGNACPIDGASGKRLKRVGWNANLYVNARKSGSKIKYDIKVGSKSKCAVKP